DCTLDQYLKEKDCKLSDKMIVNMTVQILKGIYALHDKNIAHCDIKLENILIFKSKKEEDVRLKVGDLGFGCYCDEKSMLNHYAGSPLYASPEITLFIPYNALKSDI